MAKDAFWVVVTFEAGVINTCLSALWFLFMFRTLRTFVSYIWSMGIFKFLLAISTTVIIGPLPTLVNLITLPVLRLLAFVKLTMQSSSEKSEVADISPSNGAEAVDKPDKPEPPEKKAPSSASIAVSSDDRGPRAALRQRKKKEPDEDKEKRNKAVMMGEATPSGGTDQALLEQPGGPMPDIAQKGVWNIITWSGATPVKGRQKAADVVQFDLLLILTKPIIPLFMLICVGQVWNGLFSSLFIGHALRRFVPQMSYESHHMLCSLFGAMHTLLGVSASQVENYASQEGRQMLHLTWSWSFKDVLSVVFMAFHGSMVTAVSSLGNEPSFSASFGAGIALRIALAQDSVRASSLVKIAGQKVDTVLRDLGVQLDAAEEVVAYSGGGIGDCAGGPFRMLFGDGHGAQIAAFVLKVWLMILPLLATMHWLHRTFMASRNVGKRYKFRRLIQRLVLAALGILQCVMMAGLELNASNGALANFWVAMLFGCVVESLLSTYDTRGSVRQILFLLIFLAI
jgi:hypothetical protein